MDEAIVDEGCARGATQWGPRSSALCFFMITGFHGLHVSAGVIYLVIVAMKVGAATTIRKGYEIVEIAGSIGTSSTGLGVHLRVLLSLVGGGMSAHMKVNSIRSKIYFGIWGLLFVFSASSYADQIISAARHTSLEGYPAVHVPQGRLHRRDLHAHGWERFALSWRFSCRRSCCSWADRGLMAVEGDYTELTLLDFVSAPLPAGHAEEH